MELRHLRYFVAVAEELHFGRAAHRLNIAASPLSQRIRDLEKELGVALFVRTSRRVMLTEEGRLLLEHARQALAALDRGFEAIRVTHRGKSGLIAIGAVAAASYTLVPAVLREFNRAQPDAAIRFTELTSGQQKAALLDRRIDIGFTRGLSASPILAVEPLSSERLCLALPADHPAAHKPNLGLADLADANFIMFTRHMNPELHDWIFTACREAGFTPKVAQEGNDAHTILALVAAGLGVAMVAAELQNLKRPGVAYRELPAGQIREFELSLAWRKRDRSPLVESFVTAARAVAQKARS